MGIRSEMRKKPSVLLLFLDEVQDVEALNVPVREEAVDRVSLVIEELKDGAQLGNDEELNVPLGEVGEL